MFAKHCATRLRPSASESATERLDGAVRELFKIASFARSTIHKDLRVQVLRQMYRGREIRLWKGAAAGTAMPPKNDRCSGVVGVRKPSDYTF